MAEYGHYTTIAGLMGIVREQEIWATNIKFLNDKQEFQHALNMILALLPQSTILREQPDNEVHKQFIARIQENVAALSGARADSVFTLSFSEEIDLLSQWRGYCSNNNGYCLTIDAPQLFESLKDRFDNIHFVRCVYDQKEKSEKLFNLLNTGWIKYLNAPSVFKGDTEHHRSTVVDEMAKEIKLLASYFKHPSFAEEKEHRIVIILDQEQQLHEYMRFREGRFSIVPYLALPSSREFIKKIVIGPTVHRTLAVRALQTFLEYQFKTGWLGLPTSIQHSEIPYRPL